MRGFLKESLRRKGEVVVMVDAWVDEDLDKLTEGRHPYSKDDQGRVDTEHLILIGEPGRGRTRLRRARQRAWSSGAGI
jgi:hypothetical protein